MTNTEILIRYYAVHCPSHVPSIFLKCLIYFGITSMGICSGVSEIELRVRVPEKTVLNQLLEALGSGEIKDAETFKEFFYYADLGHTYIHFTDAELSRGYSPLFYDAQGALFIGEIVRTERKWTHVKKISIKNEDMNKLFNSIREDLNNPPNYLMLDIRRGGKVNCCSWAVEKLEAIGINLNPKFYTPHYLSVLDGFELNEK